jgi:uncharacterized protein
MLFLDTSALIKIYLPEIGSTWIQNFVMGNQIVISELALYECSTLLRRRYQEGFYTRQQSASIYAQIRLDTKSFSIIPLRSDRQLPRVIIMSFNLPNQFRLRALDAIHLAAAQIANEAAGRATPPEPFTFVSSDRQLLQVAQTQGFNIENPETHP